ncbi:hypothetical protein FQA39_LY07068 [Lamprigera yunnana]|nr:hypothetical protein FQA39_LY07068 [Lamprigera yunnana]
MEKKKKRVPPDGGWGWVIVFAFALFNFLVVPMFQNYGLIFRNKFREIGLSAADESFIVTSGLAIGMLAGFSYGPILKKFGYRKVCLTSALFTSFGTIIMMFANSMLGFIVTYGLFTSIGIASGMTGYSFALNSYFLKKRSFATGFAFTITCMGSILMPQLLSFLLSIYDVKGTVLIVGGLTLNTFVSALLLQPVKWHMKEVDDDDIINEINNASLRNAVYTIKIDDKDRKEELQSYGNHRTIISVSTTTISSDPNLKVTEEERIGLKKMLYNVAHTFDLSLLKDGSFINLLFGIALANFAELSFSSLTPFILSDLNFTIPEIAMFLSSLSVSDLIFRFITPFIGRYLNQSSRSMCMVSFCLLTLTRFTLLFHAKSFAWIIVIALCIGTAKGIRTVYWTLVIPDYVPLRRLPSASGLSMFLNGIVLLAGGPLLGVARDLTGNYVNCIYITNSITMMAIAMWSCEILYTKWKKCASQEITKL